MVVLGIETSCDETSVAVVVSPGPEVLSNEVYSQIAAHQPFGGVVPELAARRHVDVLPGLIGKAIHDADVGWEDLDALAVTAGPGLASSLLVGVSAAKALALRLKVPLYPVNHLEGHVCSVFLGANAPRAEEACPMLVLLVTGGHTCLIAVDCIGGYRMLGQTLDDAAGEALDKGASMLGLPYPGGPSIEKAAQGGDPSLFAFPRGRVQGSSLRHLAGMEPELCFSYSGVKTSLLYRLRDLGATPAPGQLADLAAGYQEAVFDALLLRVEAAMDRAAYASFACVGGVARNQCLRGKLLALSESRDVPLLLAQPEYCTDNAAMIAATHALRSPTLRQDTGFACDVRPVWPLGAG